VWFVCSSEKTVITFSLAALSVKAAGMLWVSAGTWIFLSVIGLLQLLVLGEVRFSWNMSFWVPEIFGNKETENTLIILMSPFIVGLLNLMWIWSC
jgi:hypothetical protein